MRAVDTDVLVRLLVTDAPDQTVLAEEFIEAGAWAPSLAVAEAIWVLKSVYQLNHQRLVLAIELLLNNDSLILQDSDAIHAALVHFRARPSMGFMDCLLLEIARKAGHLPLGTFDRKLSTLPGAERIRASSS